MKKIFLLIILSTLFAFNAFAESGWQGDDAINTKTDTTDFSGILSDADDSVQAALETIDSLTYVGAEVDPIWVAAEPSYLLASGARNGASSQAQTFLNNLIIDKDQDSLTEFRIVNDNSGVAIENIGLTFYDGASKGFSIERINNTGATTINNTSGNLIIGTTTSGDTYLTSAGTLYFNSTADIANFGDDAISTTGTLGAGAITGTSIIKSGGTSSEFLKADGSVDSSIYYKSGDTIVVGNDTNISGNRHHWHISIVNPNAVVTASAIIPIFSATDAALTITKIQVTTSSASYEVAGDLKYASARIGLASATVINAFDTSSGVLTDTSMTSWAVASGKFVYLSFDSVPSSSMTDVVIDIYWDYN